MARALRRKASSAAALALLACGGFAGAAFGDGLPIGSLTTSILPTIGVTTAVSTPTVPVSVTVPPVTTAVTTPAVTTAVTTPAVTTPPVTTPSVTTPKVALPPVSVSATVPVPPSSTPIAATVSTPAASASVSASTSPTVTAHVNAAAPKAAVSATVGSNGGVQAQAAATLTTPSAPNRGSVSASAAVPAPALPLAVGSVTSGSSPVAVSVSGAPASVHTAGLPSPSRSAIGPRPAPVSTIPRLVPFTAAASPVRGVPSVVPELRPVPTATASPSGSVWSTVAKNPGAAAGGIAALLALAGLGIAGAARSSVFAAACAELARFPFPRFRVLPCPDLRAPAGASGVAAGSNAAGPAAANGARTPSRHVRGGSVPPFPPLLRIGGVLGASVTKTPWTILKAIVVAMLAVVNAVVLGIRWRVGRLQSR